MAGFTNINDVVDAINGGKTTWSNFRKSIATATSVRVWFDLSVVTGNPRAQYYASSPLVASVMQTQGMNIGSAVNPEYKYLYELFIMTADTNQVPNTYILCDYLLYYPFIDQSETDAQTTDNTVTLPRYTDGNGVQMMAILVAPQAGGSTFSVSYTNSDGTAGRTTPTFTCNTATATGSLITTEGATVGASTPFLTLQGKDTGVRSVESITCSGTDTGLFTIVLVKPIATITLRDTTAPVELNFLTTFPSLPKIEDGAYLNMICLPSVSLASTSINGMIRTVWS